MIQECEECVRWIVIVGRVVARSISQQIVRDTAVVVGQSINLDAPLPVIGKSRMEEDHGWPPAGYRVPNAPCGVINSFITINLLLSLVNSILFYLSRFFAAIPYGTNRPECALRTPDSRRYSNHVLHNTADDSEGPINQILHKTG